MNLQYYFNLVVRIMITLILARFGVIAKQLHPSGVLIEKHFLQNVFSSKDKRAVGRGEGSGNRRCKEN